MEPKDKLQQAYALLKDVAADSLECYEDTLDDRVDLIAQRLEHAVLAVREAMNLLDVWPSENLDDVTTPERQYIDAILACEPGWWEAYEGLYDAAEISLKQQMFLFEGTSEETLEAAMKHEWLFRSLDWSEQIFYRGTCVLMIEHDAEDGNWGMTATFEDGTTERRKN